MVETAANTAGVRTVRDLYPLSENDEESRGRAGELTSLRITYLTFIKRLSVSCFYLLDDRVNSVAIYYMTAFAWARSEAHTVLWLSTRAGKMDTILRGLFMINVDKWTKVDPGTISQSLDAWWFLLSLFFYTEKKALLHGPFEGASSRGFRGFLVKTILKLVVAYLTHTEKQNQKSPFKPKVTLFFLGGGGGGGEGSNGTNVLSNVLRCWDPFLEGPGQNVLGPGKP